MPPGSSPADEQRKSIARQLVPWRVIYLYRRNIQPRSNKFLLVLHASQFKVVYFFISTDAAPLPELADAQVAMPCQTHPFLRWDSYIDCSRVCYEDYSEVERQLMKDPTRVKGRIAKGQREKVLEAVRTSRHLARHHITLILESLGAEPDAD